VAQQWPSLNYKQQEGLQKGLEARSQFLQTAREVTDSVFNASDGFLIGLEGGTSGIQAARLYEEHGPGQATHGEVPRLDTACQDEQKAYPLQTQCPPYEVNASTVLSNACTMNAISITQEGRSRLVYKFAFLTMYHLMLPGLGYS
jgi:hypothetical protein